MCNSVHNDCDVIFDCCFCCDFNPAYFESFGCILVAAAFLPIVLLQRGYTSLHFASQKGHLSVAEYLINKGAVVNAFSKVSKIIIYYS